MRERILERERKKEGKDNKEVGKGGDKEDRAYEVERGGRRKATG